MFSNLKEKFIQDFLTDGRWKFITSGIRTTLIVTVLALILGVVIGMVVAIIRCAHDQQSKGDLRGPGGFFLKLGNLLCKIYITVIRGTPTLVQLLIMFYVIMVSSNNKVLIAVLTFSINSGAYVAEIIRGGIMAVDQGQMEAGRSLGLGYVPTMRSIVLPQAFKSVLPALGNELITLLKETSICGFIGLNELTRGGDIIRAATFDALLPLFVVALIYLAMVMVLSWFLGILERRLRRSDHR